MRAAAALVLATGTDGHGSLRPSFGTFAQPRPATDRPRCCFQNAAMPTTHAGISPGASASRSAPASGSSPSSDPPSSRRRTSWRLTRRGSHLARALGARSPGRSRGTRWFLARASCLRGPECQAPRSGVGCPAEPVQVAQQPLAPQPPVIAFSIALLATDTPIFSAILSVHVPALLR